MEGYAPWISYYHHDPGLDNGNGEAGFDENEKVIDEEDKRIVFLDSVLPDDLLERILSHLPIPSLFRAGCVSKKWHEIVTSKRLCSMVANIASQKPWYFMFTGTEGPFGYLYDPTIRKWHGLFSLPGFVTSSWFIASSSGLVCFMNNDNRSDLYVYNPLTKRSKNLMEPPGLKHSDYSALAISVDSVSLGYAVVVVKSNQVPENFHQWDVSIHLYDSETMMWVTLAIEVLNGWRGGYASVICNGVLYFLIYATGGAAPDNRHGLVWYDLSHRSSHGVLLRNFIPIPFSLTCGRLMNLKKKLVMVGGLGKQDRSDIIKGIGIWVLNGTQWQEITRMPQKFFQGFGEFDDVFASSGTDDMIYIQSYGGPALLVFDVTHKQWKWTQKCPVVKKFPLQLFNGFCFEPRLDIDP